MKFPTLALILALGLGGAGCSDEDEFVPSTLPECPDYDYRLCDTRGAACQKRLLDLTACVYGAEQAPQVPVHVLSEAQFRELLETDLEQQQDMRTPEEIAATEALEAALVDLELVATGALSVEARLDELVTNLAGVYIDAETGVILIDHGTPTNNIDANALLVHELVHALQDADYDLDTWVEPYRASTDALLAARSVTEGQATYYQFRVASAMLGHRIEDVDFARTLGRLRDDLDQRAREDPSPYVASGRTFPYAYGAMAALQGWVDDGPGYEAALIGTPPLSTSEILRQLSAPGAAPRPPLELAEPSPTGDYELVEDDVLGAWLLGIFLTKHGFIDAQGLVDDWAGDHLWVYRNAATDARAWLWQLSFRTEDAAATVQRGIEAETNNVVVEREASRLLVTTAGAPPDLVEAGRSFMVETRE